MHLDAAPTPTPADLPPAVLIPPAGDLAPDAGDVAPKTPFLKRVGGLAMAAAVAYGIHRGLDSGVFDGAREAAGSPAAEVGEVAIISSTLAVTGLREFVTNRRTGRTGRQLRRAEKKQQDSLVRAADADDSFRRVMKGEKVPYTRLVDGERVPYQDVKPLSRAESRKRNGGHFSSGSVKKMVRKRNKANMYAREKGAEEFWYGRLMPVVDAEGNTAWVNDLGTPSGELRADRESITHHERKSHTKARKRAAHAHHKVHGITEKTKRSTVGAHEREAEHYAKRQTKLENRREKLSTKKTAIINREDLVSRVYDKSKDRAIAGSKAVYRTAARASGATVRAGHRGLRSSGRAAMTHINKQVAGIMSAKDVYREAKDEEVEGGRIQHQINKIARNLGQRRSKI